MQSRNSVYRLAFSFVVWLAFGVTSAAAQDQQQEQERYLEFAKQAPRGSTEVLDLRSERADSGFENGGFETGSFSGWVAGDNGLGGLNPWEVCLPFSCGYFGNNEPREGQYDALNGFDGDAGYEAFLYQDIQVPASGGAVSLWYRIQYDGLGIPSSLPRVYEIQIRDLDNNVLAVPFRQEILLNGAAYTNLGWRKLVLDVSSYADQIIRFYASLFVPESFTGPAQLELDDFALQQLPTLPTIGSITGRVVDAVSGQPLPGDASPFAVAELFRCDDGGCFEFLNSQVVDSEGRFLFDRDFSGRSLPVGAYQVRAFANEYQPGETGLFQVNEGEDVDAGDVTLAPPPPSIESITGRIVDALSGQPLPGEASPFAFAELFRCDAGDCFEYVNGQAVDSEGRFLFDRDFSGQSLPVGTYQVRAFANDYQEGESEPFEVGEGDEVDIGDIALEPPPISFSDIEPCDELLPQGGTCRYSVRINNNTSAPLRGLAWSLVDGFGLGSSLGFTNFEASASRRGSSRSMNVRRQRVSLRAFSSGVFGFQFDVSSFVQDGATFCTRLFFGLEPDPLVNTIREGFLFCITKGVTGFQVMSESESQELLRAFSGSNKMMMRSDIPPRTR